MDTLFRVTRPRIARGAQRKPSRFARSATPSKLARSAHHPESRAAQNEGNLVTVIGPLHPSSERVSEAVRAAPANGRSLPSGECGAHANDGDGNVFFDEPCRHAQGVDPLHREDPIAGNVILAPPRVDSSVDLDGKGNCGSIEVDDEPTEDDLPSKAAPELGAAELLPQEPFRPGRRFPHATSAGREERRREFEGTKTVAHEGLRAGEWAGFEPLPRRARDSGKFRPHRLARPLARDVRDGSTPAHSPARRNAPNRIRTIAGNPRQRAQASTIEPASRRVSRARRAKRRAPTAHERNKTARALSTSP